MRVRINGVVVKGIGCVIYHHSRVQVEKSMSGVLSRPCNGGERGSSSGQVRCVSISLKLNLALPL